jgi:hypothetical protein
MKKIYLLLFFVPFVTFGAVLPNPNTANETGHITVTIPDTALTIFSCPQDGFNAIINVSYNDSPVSFNPQNDGNLYAPCNTHYAVYNELTTNGGCQIDYTSCLSDTGLLQMYSISFVNAVGGGVLFSTPTVQNTAQLVAEVGSVSNDTFKSALPYMLIFMGVPLAFYIIKKLLFITKLDDLKTRLINEKADRVIAESEKLTKSRSK